MELKDLLEVMTLEDQCISVYNLKEQRTLYSGKVYYIPFTRKELRSEVIRVATFEDDVIIVTIKEVD